MEVVTYGTQGSRFASLFVSKAVLLVYNADFFKLKLLQRKFAVKFTFCRINSMRKNKGVNNWEAEESSL